MQSLPPPDRLYKQGIGQRSQSDVEGAVLQKGGELTLRNGVDSNTSDKDHSGNIIAIPATAESISAHQGVQQVHLIRDVRQAAQKLRAEELAQEPA